MSTKKTISKTLAAAALATLTLHAEAQDYWQPISMEGVDLVGSITYGKVDEFTYMEEGFYKFDQQAKFAPDKTNPIHACYAPGGSVYHDGKIYANEFNDGGNVQKEKPVWRVYDAKTYQLLSEHVLKDNCESTTSSLAYDPTEDCIYGLNYTYTETYVVKVDPETGDMTRLGDMLDRKYKYFAIACSPKGQLYCTYLDLDENNVYLGKIRKSDGKVAKISAVKAKNLLPGDSFINSGSDQAMFYNNADGKLYWMFGSSSMMLYKDYTAIMEVNTTTADATLVAYLEDMLNISGAFFLEPDMKAPGIISDFSFVPKQEGSTTGKLRFALPSTAYDGTTLTGDVAVRVEQDGVEIAEATAEPGSTYETDDLEFTNDMHNVSITVSNQAGDGPTVRRSFYVGYDVPAACTNIKLTADGLRTTLTWDAPEKGKNGATIDKGDLTYKVVRYPYEVVVAEGLTQTRFEEDHPADMTRYVYEVVPCAGGREGVKALSNNLIVGTPLDVPYGGPFTGIADMLNYYTLIDANKDYSTWAFDQNTNSAVYVFNQVNAADDWMISPPINYRKGHTYELKFKAYSSSATYVESLQVTFGKDRTPEAQTEVWLDLPELPSLDADGQPAEYKKEFTVNEDGVYYYGFHAVSANFREFLYLSDISVVDKNTSEVLLPSAQSGASISVKPGFVKVHNPDGLAIEVCNTGGGTTARSTEKEATFSLPRGLYLVHVGNRTFKAAVK